MALVLENEFVVAASVDATWQTLLDLERVSRCLPGATIGAPEPDGAFPGTMRVKLGPVTMDYKGAARLEDVDEAARVAVFGVTAREVRGQGTASARISNSLSAENGATRVAVVTELNVTGRPAQFGRGIMQDVAASMLDDFARSLSELMAADGAEAGAAAAESPRAAETLNLTGAVGGVLRGRLARWTGVVALRRLLSRG